MGDFLSALEEGTRIGPVVIGEAIGQGGEGIIYRARHDRLGDVAVKEFFPGLVASRNREGSVRGANPAFRRAFESGLEAFNQIGERLIQLDPHQNVVRFNELIQQDTAYLVMQFVDGYDLAKAIERGEFGNSAQVIELADCLSSALVHLHKAQIWHRDIAPDNILIRERDGQIYLIDFNAAKDLVHDVTHSTEVLSKPGYSPPEQYLGTGDAMSAASDIYAASAVLYHAITGKRPPDSGKRRSMDTLEQVSQLAAGRFPPDFLAAIDRGLQLDAPKRPQTAGQWRQELGIVRPGEWESRPKTSGGGKSLRSLVSQLSPRRIKGFKLAMIAAGAAAAVTILCYVSGIGPFGSDSTPSGDASEQAADASDAAAPPAPSQSELDWESGMKSARLIVDGLWYLRTDKGVGTSFSAEQYDFAGVSVAVAGSDASLAVLPEQSYDQSNYPFGASEFRRMRYGAAGRYFIDGDRLSAADPAIFELAKAAFGDPAGKKLTVEIGFKGCINPGLAIRQKLVPPPPCTKITDAKGRPIPTLWTVRLTLNDDDFILTGSFEVRNKDTMTLELNPINSRGDPVYYDDGSLMSFGGNCSFERKDSLKLTCVIFKNNGKEYRFTTDMDLVSRGKIEGSGSFEGGGTFDVTLDNPRSADGQ